ncbi:MAG: hypothetical protein JNK14_12175 [Chitinophagaceae bacterium]|nr:hypothetical protein [Chitinophagaceae bacterium]
MIKKSIISLNIFFTLGSAYVLFEDYKRIGKFQWVDENRIQDNEELFLKPICAIMILMGIISIANQLYRSSDRDKYRSGIIKKYILEPLCLFYAAFAIFIGIVFLALGAGNTSVSFEKDFKDIFFSLLTFLSFACYCLMGFLTLYQTIRERTLSGK